MKYILIVLILGVILSNCTKVNTCHPRIKKLKFSSGELRTNGFYYHLSDGKISPDFFLYTDGIVLPLGGGGRYQVEQIDSVIASWNTTEFDNIVHKSKVGWGVFVVYENKIEMESYVPSSGGASPLYLYSGRILNDSTFVFEKAESCLEKEKIEKRELFFWQTNSKPDSTNSFF